MIGMFSICSAVRVALFSPELSGVRATSALTETVSETVATLRASWRSERLSPDRSSMPVTSWVLKPAMEIWTVYVAAGSAANAKNPSAFVTDRRTAFDDSLMTVTSAPGMTPPDSSTTLPLNSPVMRCAYVVPGSARSATRKERATRVIAFAVPLLALDILVTRLQ